MSIIISLILIIFSLSSEAKLSNLTCSKDGTMIFFINGINVDIGKSLDDFSSQSDILTSSLIKYKIDSKNNVLPPVVMHNRSEGKYRDIAETFYLLMQRNYESGIHKEFPSPMLAKSIFQILVSSMMSNKAIFKRMCPDLPKLPKPEHKPYCDEMMKIILEKQKSYTFKDLGDFRQDVLKTLKGGKKVILVTHSAGAMFADRIRDYINRYYSEYSDYIGHLAIARPFRSNHSDNQVYINFSQDSLLEFIDSSGLRDTVPQNARLTMDCPIEDESDKAYPNHAFKCYTSNIEVEDLLTSKKLPAIDFVADGIYEAAETLENNDENCCNKQKGGKTWRNEEFCNAETPEFCNSGFISSKSTLNINDDSLVINSFFCGDYEIDNKPHNTHISQSRFEGSGIITGQFSSYLAHLKQGTYLDAHIERLDFNKTVINDTTKFSGNTIRVLESELSGLNHFDSNSDSSWMLIEKSQFRTSGLTQSKYFTSGSGDSSIIGSVLENIFDFKMNNTRISNSTISAKTNLTGKMQIFDSFILAPIEVNSTDHVDIGNVRVEGPLEINGTVQISDTIFRGTNFLSGGRGGISNAEIENSNLHGRYSFSGLTKHNIKNLIISNTSGKHLNFGPNSWSGTLKLYGSMSLHENRFGNNVTVYASESDDINYNLELLNSDVSDELTIIESGTLENCNFVGSGSSYTKTCELASKKPYKFNERLPKKRSLVNRSSYALNDDGSLNWKRLLDRDVKTQKLLK